MLLPIIFVTKNKIRFSLSNLHYVKTLCEKKLYNNIINLKINISLFKKFNLINLLINFID